MRKHREPPEVELRKPIPVFRPWVDEEEVQAAREVILSGWMGLGPKTEEFERKFAEFIGAKFAVGTNSCSSALHLALVVCGTEGREVISPSLSFVSTNHAILWSGGVPVFADVDEETLTLDVEDVARKITPNTRAIIAMHYGGHPCDMDGLKALTKGKDILIVEDAAHACGSEYKGRKAGTLGDIACFSFHAVKNLTTGEGGMVVTDSQEVRDRLVRLRWLGITKSTWTRSAEKKGDYSWYYDVAELGYKYHMSDLAAAIGLVQLKKLAESNRLRRIIVAKYNEAFAGLPWLKTPVELPHVKSANHNYVVKAERREEFIEHLKKRGVSASVHYVPNHHYAIFEDFSKDVPTTEKVWKKLVTLPLYPGLSDSDISLVIDAVRSFSP